MTNGYSVVGSCLSVAMFELGQIRYAMSIMERGIVTKIESFNAEVDSAKSRYADDDGEQDDSEYGDLCHLFRYPKYFGITMAYAVFERFLMEVFNFSRLELEDLRGKDDESLSFRKYQAHLKKLGIDLCQAPFDIEALISFNASRNSIMHRGSESERRWRDGQYVPGDEVKIKDEYPTECIDLVQRTCALITEQYDVLARAAVVRRGEYEKDFDPTWLWDRTN